MGFFPTFWQGTVKNFHITVILKRNEISILHVSLRKHYYKFMCIFFQRTKALFSCATPLLLYISFHKIPFHLKTSEFDVHLFSTLYINALFVSRSYQKAMHKQNIKNPMSNTIVRLPLMQIHVQQNGLGYCKDLPGNPNQFFMVLDFRLDFNTEAKGES